MAMIVFVFQFHSIPNHPAGLLGGDSGLPSTSIARGMVTTPDSEKSPARRLTLIVVQPAGEKQTKPGPEHHAGAGQQGEFRQRYFMFLSR